MEYHEASKKTKKHIGKICEKIDIDASVCVINCKPGYFDQWLSDGIIFINNPFLNELGKKMELLKKKLKKSCDTICVEDVPIAIGAIKHGFSPEPQTMSIVIRFENLSLTNNKED